MERPIKMLFAGEGGQGVQTIAKLFTKAAFEQGLHTIYIPNFGVEQRGGVSMAFVQVWDQQVDAPKFQIADFTVVLSDRAYERIKMHIGKETKIIYDPYTVKTSEDSIKSSVKESYSIPAIETSKVQLSPRSANILILGAMSDLTNVLNREILIDQMHKKFKKYYESNSELRDLNERAFKLGERFMPGGETGD